MLPDDLDARLAFEARRRGQSVAAVAREAIGVYLRGHEVDDEPSFIGLGDGVGDGTTSDHVDEVVRRLVDERHERGAR